MFCLFLKLAVKVIKKVSIVLIDVYKIHYNITQISNLESKSATAAKKYTKFILFKLLRELVLII